MVRGTPNLRMRRRGAAMLLVCAMAQVGCIQWIDLYSCSEESGGDQGETVPPCSEAGVSDASQDAPDAATNDDADASLKAD